MPQCMSRDILQNLYIWSPDYELSENGPYEVKGLKPGVLKVWKKMAEEGFELPVGAEEMIKRGVYDPSGWMWVNLYSTLILV